MIATPVQTPAIQHTPAPPGQRAPTRVLSALVFALASLIGVFAFIAPFFLPTIAQNTAGMGGQAYSPLFLVTLLLLSLGALMLEAQGRAMNAKLIALLGVLIAINSALRLAETVLPGPGGFSPVFMLIILTGCVFGARVGFLMGALSLLVSAFVTGGIGPWLPYQMFTAGWMGMTAGIFSSIPPLVPRSGTRIAGDFRLPIFDSSESKIGNRKSKIRFGALLAFAAAWGFLYGAIMNLWSWPFLAGDPAQSWQAGLSVADGIKRYAVYYVATSLWWDAFAAIGNVMLLALFGLPTLKVLLRFKRKFLFEIGD
jgi:energy-coupling factor transport system substrate-specific component